METNFNVKKLFDDRIKDHIKMIRLACNEYQIPMFMTFAVENSPKGTKYVTEMYSAEACNRELSDDHLVKHGLVERGFEVVEPSSSEPVYEEALEDNIEQNNFDL